MIGLPWRIQFGCFIVAHTFLRRVDVPGRHEYVPVGLRFQIMHRPAHVPGVPRDVASDMPVQTRQRPQRVETNAALGKAIGLLHAMSEEEPRATSTKTARSDS